jgi:hypothetical protein
LTLGDKKSDADAKEMMCKIIHDKAIHKLCTDNNLMITSISEQIYGSNGGCIGQNFSCKDISISLRYNCNTFLEYFDVIAILIHELVHHSRREHDENFKNLEHIYRVQYIANARATGEFPSWIPIKFPESTGARLMISRPRNKSVLYFYTQYLLFPVCGMIMIYAVAKSVAKYK